MNLRLVTVCTAVIIVIFCFSCDTNDDNKKISESKFQSLTESYFGQDPPGVEAEMFANDLISVGKHEAKISFSPDGNELIVNVMTPKGQLLVEPMGVFGKGYAFYSKYENGLWTEPKEFLFDSGFKVSYPFFSPDGTRVFFNSTGPIADTTYESQLAIWYVDKEVDGWSKPNEILLGDDYKGSYGIYPSVSSNGNLYFAMFPDEVNGYIHVCKYDNGNYSFPERLSDVINEVGGNHPYVAPDESYIIYDSDGKDPEASKDIYISFRGKDGSWKKPQKFGDAVNTVYDERRPFVSYDGKYLFFASDRINPEIPDRPMTISQLQKLAKVPANSQQHLYWVDARVIQDLRKQD